MSQREVEECRLEGQEGQWQGSCRRKLICLDTGALSDSALGTLTKEIKKTEDNLHTKIGRLLAKELDKQRKPLGCSHYSLNH